MLLAKWFSGESNADVRRTPRPEGVISERLGTENDLCVFGKPADPGRLSRCFLHRLGSLFPVLSKPVREKTTLCLFQ